MIKKHTKWIAGVVLVLLLVVGSLVYYFNYNMNIIRQDYDKKILELNSQISAYQENLSSKLGSIDVDLQNFKMRNVEQINALSDLIDQIEQQSNIQLKELKEELKDIRIQSADFSAIVEDVLQSVVSIKTDLGQGSGVIADRDGYIVTNVHVIEGASAIKVKTYSGRSYDVNILAGYDVSADIAVLKIDAQNLKALEFGNSDELKVGGKVIAAGNPAGLSFTITEGIVSAFRTGENNIRYIQTDVPINPGNSGGPLINTKGEIVGINNFKVRGFEGLGFAIASNDVRSIVKRIITEYEANSQ